MYSSTWGQFWGTFWSRHVCQHTHGLQKSTLPAFILVCGLSKSICVRLWASESWTTVVHVRGTKHISVFLSLTLGSVFIAYSKTKRALCFTFCKNLGATYATASQPVFPLMNSEKLFCFRNCWGSGFPAAFLQRGQIPPPHHSYRCK